MKTEELIDALAEGEENGRRPRGWRALLIAVCAGLVLAVLLLVTGLGMRPDIGTAMMPVMWKAGFSAALAAAALPVLLRLAAPGRPLGWRLLAYLGFAAIALTAGAIALMGEAPGERMQAWTGGGFPWCLVIVPLLAAPTAALLIWLVRGLAPTSLTATGAAIGAVAGGIGALAYSMYCPIDSVAFVTTWYSVAIGLCAALGALVGGRLLRW
ncbi:MAG: NrsF family protein [Hyphomonadaceae bacterium]